MTEIETRMAQFKAALIPALANLDPYVPLTIHIVCPNRQIQIDCEKKSGNWKMKWASQSSESGEI